MKDDYMLSVENSLGPDSANSMEEQVKLTDKLERMGKLVKVMRDDEEALAAYKVLHREVEPEITPLLDLVRSACLLAPSKWDHVAIIDDINDVVHELLPESQMSVTHLSEDGFGIEWIHDCGASLCHLFYGDGSSHLGVKIPCSKTMMLALSSIARKYGLVLDEYLDDDEDDEDDGDDEDDDATAHLDDDGTL